MKVVISSAHAKFVSGAVGIINEVTESRRMVPKVAEYLRAAGVEASTWNDDISKTQAANIGAIVAHHNSIKNRDLDVSIHFNAASKTDSPRGVEVLFLSQDALAAKVSKAIAGAAGLVNRGAKPRSNLGFLSRTTAKAILIEVCFVDSSHDVRLYQQHFDAIARSIAEAISGKTIKPAEPAPPLAPAEPSAPGTMPQVKRGDRGQAVEVLQNLLRVKVDGDFGPITETAVKDFQKRNSLVADGIVGPLTWAKLLAPIEEGAPVIHTDIVATVFGGAKDPNQSAYDGHWIDDVELGVALPFKFRNGPPPPVRVTNRANNKSVVTPLIDVGPHMIDDAAYVEGTSGERPVAETCFKNKTPLPRGPHQGKVPLNGAGIDLTPGAAKAIGLVGLGNVDWSFEPIASV